MRYLFLSLLFVASICRADTFTPVPSKIIGPGGSKISIEGGNATIQPSSGGAVNVVTGAVYVPTVLDFSTSVSPLVSASGHSSLAFNGTNLVLSINGGGYITLGGTAWGAITGTLSSQSDLNSALSSKQSTITFGTGVQTALGVNVGSAGAPVLFNGAGGTPSSLTLTNATGLPADGVTGTAVTQTTLNNATLPASVTTLAASGTVTFTDSNSTLTHGSGTINLFALNDLHLQSNGSIAMYYGAGIAFGASGGVASIGLPLDLGGDGRISSVQSITGKAGNMTITSGTGNSRTLAFQTTTSGGVATTALTLDAIQDAIFAGNVSAIGNIQASATAGASIISNNIQGYRQVSVVNSNANQGAKFWPASGDTVEIVNIAESGDGSLQCLNLRPFGDVVCGTAGKGLQLKSGPGARAGHATLVGGTITIANTTVTANTECFPVRKTPGGTLGQSLSWSIVAGTSLTITSVDATGVLVGLDTSVVSYHLIEVNP